MLFLRSLVFHCLFYSCTVLLMLVWLPTLVTGPRGIVQELGRQWGRTTLWLLENICGLKHEIRGLENIPKGAVIVAAKHQSTWDTFTLPIFFPDFSFILKHELVYLPLFGWYLLRAEQIAIDRAKGRKAMPQLIAKAKALFAQGRQLFIFPEGTRRPAGAPPAYKFGVALIYQETGAQVVPVVLNAGLFWPRHALLIRPGVAVMEFLPPIAPGLDARAFFAELQERLEAGTEKLLQEAAAKDSAIAAIIEKNRLAPAPAPAPQRAEG
ncbi:1-acyl-sn-glycerol-3-phosphate acyltransferase [Methylocystis bryophila]|uniref:1-acyl-sn-glycerol-3-phosphate acyltransferase n=1 Tax=Methylocystis bryophila TaxID=655015 RepID=A0A1W6N0V3_9HYPH|nr:lysophospholipid acyltransferase family protein [Methylocystis bryophila]ARN83465.1 1-acyl-sn-glycerol-3-phosphate acyltransferase [Methylocystis bryophila]